MRRSRFLTVLSSLLFRALMDIQECLGAVVIPEYHVCIWERLLLHASFNCVFFFSFCRELGLERTSRACIVQPPTWGRIIHSLSKLSCCQLGQRSPIFVLFQVPFYTANDFLIISLRSLIWKPSEYVQPTRDLWELGTHVSNSAQKILF